MMMMTVIDDGDVGDDGDDGDTSEDGGDSKDGDDGQGGMAGAWREGTTGGHDRRHGRRAR